ncbi:unnamed protein product [Adineta steineri]|uniref:F-box domain-containing protein n=1 Tax=Adineta steineri TaxID=433720 RepID=A0A814XUJ1_9BILA|nr:unnamed protein product [Adineta steineri]CAF4026000.1 unnamed protein product [Adineta steineri]
MNCRTAHLLDLSDEILLIILKKLDSVDVLYSLLNVNKRLDQMARSVNNTKFLNFSMNNVQLNRFCCEILPQIHHNIVELTLDIFSMERILLACEYPNLTVIVLTNFLPDILLQYLTEFSLTSYLLTYDYDCRILSLLRRMPNLETLTFGLDIVRSSVIDGLHLNEELFIHMKYLNKFIFHICTVLRTSQTNNFLTANDIKNTFLNWKYSSVNCCIDHFSDGYSYYHIYSTPFQMTHFTCLSNSFHGQDFLYVTNLWLFDGRPFEHDFFEWLSQACPSLKHLLIDNLTPQANKRQVTIIDDKRIFSKSSYLHLFKLKLVDAHIDYVDQFLCYTNTYLPTLHILIIQYDKLVAITDNFTNDAKQINCSQIKRIVFDQSLVLTKDFYDYFPCL